MTKETQGRLHSFRAGDRAEQLGMAILQGLCAVAQIPREEDFGMFDAVTTLLRRDGRTLVAEETFVVQFKTSNQRTFNLSGAALYGLHCQALPLFLGLVNLQESSLALYCLDSQICKSERTGEAINVPINKNIKLGSIANSAEVGPPILTCKAGDFENQTARQSVYEILRDWIKISSKNRMLRSLWIANEYSWKPNEKPLQFAQSQSRKLPMAALEHILPALAVLRAKD